MNNSIARGEVHGSTPGRTLKIDYQTTFHLWLATASPMNPDRESLITVFDPIASFRLDCLETLTSNVLFDI